MANFIFNVEESSFKVTQLPSVVTDCATIFTFQVTTTVGNSVRISLDNAIQTTLNYDNANFTLNGLNVLWDGADKVFTYSTPILFSYSIANSGTPGLFKKVRAEAFDDTTIEDYNYWYKDTERTNDNLSCDDPTGSGGTYDELTDTPANKTGSALKLVRVNATEDGHEYVDAGLLGVDLNYTHVQTSSSSWVIAHNLGKIPSVTVQDGSGNRVHGDVTYTDLNNLTITFNIAFAGTAYLN
jgi:hypothetical protein